MAMSLTRLGVGARMLLSILAILPSMALIARATVPMLARRIRSWESLAILTTFDLWSASSRAWRLLNLACSLRRPRFSMLRSNRNTRSFGRRPRGRGLDMEVLTQSRIALKVALRMLGQFLHCIAIVIRLAVHSTEVSYAVFCLKKKKTKHETVSAS